MSAVAPLTAADVVRERQVLAAIIAADTAELGPNMQIVLTNYLHVFSDPELTQIAGAVKAVRDQGQDPVNVTTIGRLLHGDTVIALGHLLDVVARAMSAPLAEYEAAELLRNVPPEVLVMKPAKATAALRPLSIWKPSQFLSWVEPPGSHILLPAYMTRGSLTTLIGQGGLGKSRLALWQAICQITGRQWCGLDMYGEPQKWLFLGDENSIARFQEDLRHMYLALNSGEIALLDEFLRLPAMEDLDDMDLCLRDATVQGRIALTVEQHSPGVIVADPLANIAPGDIAKPGDMKEAVRLISGLIRKVAPQAVLELLHHARTGRANIAQGVGYDAGNFASGGKALFASSRCQMNLMPGREHDETRLVLSCAKANNCERFETRGLQNS